MKQYAKRQEECVDGKKGQAIQAHVLLGIAKAGTRKILLHHILVKAGHDDDNENTTEELPPKILRRCGIPYENPAQRTGRNRLPGIRNTHLHLAHHGKHDTNERKKQAEGLKCVRADYGSYARLPRIKPYQQQHKNHRQGKSQPKRLENKGMKYHAHHVKPCSSTSKLTQQKEKGSCAMGAAAETMFEITIDARQPKTVIDRQQHEGYKQVTEGKSHTHLQIAHTRSPYPSRHRDERYSGQTGAYHAERHHQPWRTLGSTEKHFVVSAARRPATAVAHSQKE